GVAALRPPGSRPLPDAGPSAPPPPALGGRPGYDFGDRGAFPTLCYYRHARNERDVESARSQHRPAWHLAPEGIMSRWLQEKTPRSIRVGESSPVPDWHFVADAGTKAGRVYLRWLCRSSGAFQSPSGLGERPGPPEET